MAVQGIGLFDAGSPLAEPDAHDRRWVDRQAAIDALLAFEPIPLPEVTLESLVEAGRE